MKFADLKDDTAQDLGKYVDQLRAEVAFAQQGYLLPAAGDDQKSAGESGVPPRLLESFQSPEDFTVREQTLEYSNGDVYKGEALGKLRHGRGTHTSSNGDVYEGQWRFNKRHGRGKVTLHSGVQYDGEWQDDLAHGEGVARYENGGVYIGAFEREKRCGWGTHYFPDRTKYEGEWRNDIMEGKGRCTYTDGSFFEGQFEKGLRVNGKLVTGDGASEYSGGWHDLKREGYGVQFERGRFKYMGQWEGDLQHGQGKCTYADGSQYDGQWQSGKRHGRGILQAGAYRYEGEWRQDRQHGLATCQTEAGDKYTGEFVEGRRHGKGQCIYVDGSKYEGEWQNDVRHGRGTCLFASGDKYQGEWHNDKRHGRGVCKFADGRKFRGEWEDDGWVQSAADPQHCRVAGPGVTKAVAGQRGELVVEARDDTGCKRLSGGDDFQVALWGPAPGSGTLGGASGSDAAATQGMAAVTAEVQDNEDGSYAVSYTATSAGVYELHITLGDEHVAHSPYPLRVLPARPCMRRSQVSGPGRSAALAGSPAHFTVAACDEFGNRWFGEPAQLRQLLPLEVKLTGCSGEEVPAELEATREGSFLCSYTVPSPGFWRLHIDSHGQALPGAPFSVLATDPAAVPPQPAAEASVAAPARLTVGGEHEGSAEGATAGAAGDEEAALRQAPQAVGTASAAATAAAVAAPIRDEMRVWERIAAAAFAADGSMEGWDSDSEKPKESKEEQYMREHPDVPVVENLEDLWMVSRLQRARKTKEEAEKAKRLQGMRKQLEQNFGPAQRPSETEVMTAVREIIREEAGAPPLTPAGTGATTPPLGSSGSSTDEATNVDACSLPEAALAAVPALVARPAGRAGLRAAAAALASLD